MTRHELKDQIEHDAFTDGFARVIEYTSSHRQRIIQWAVAAVVLLAIIAGAVWYLASQRAARQQDLESAFRVLGAPVGQPNQFGPSFATADAKRSASLKALSDVITKDGGSRAGYIAQYYRGTLEAQQDAKAAESDLRAAADSGSEVSVLAKIALAQLYAGQNRVADGEKLLREIVNKPTDLVSKAQAEILLAQLEQSSNPADAKKQLQAAKADAARDPAVARAVDQVSAPLSK